MADGDVRTTHCFPLQTPFLSCKSVDSLKLRLRRGWLRTASLRQVGGGRGGHALEALVHSELQIFRGRHDARAATQRGTRSRTTWKPRGGIFLEFTGHRFSSKSGGARRS